MHANDIRAFPTGYGGGPPPFPAPVLPLPHGNAVTGRRGNGMNEDSVIRLGLALRLQQLGVPLPVAARAAWTTDKATFTALAGLASGRLPARD